MFALQDVGLPPPRFTRIQSGGTKLGVGVKSFDDVRVALERRRASFQRAVEIERPLNEGFVLDMLAAREGPAG
jgi:hypothetical protein